MVRIVSKIIRIVRIFNLMVRKETGLARMVMVFLIVRLVMRILWIVRRVVIMMVAMGIIIARIS